MNERDRRLLYTIVGAYLVLGLTWILLTDFLVNWLIPQGPFQVLIESSKGSLYVAITGAGLFLLVRSLLLWREESQARSRAHEVAREQVEFQAELLDSVGQAVIATDPNGQVIYWNNAAQVMYGWTAEEALGRSIVSLTVPPDQSMNAADLIVQSLARGQDWEGEFEVQRRDGTRFPAIVKDTPVLDEKGEVIAIIGITTDISDLVAARTELARSEELHRAVLENISDAVFLTTRQGELTYVCTNVDVIFGLDKDQAWARQTIGGLLGDRFEGEQVLAGEQERKNIEASITDMDGQTHDLLVTVKRVDIGAGELLYTCRDVTDRVAAEQSRQRALSRLEVLRAVDAAVLGAQSVAELAEEAVEGLSTNLSIHTATLLTANNEQRALEVVYNRGHKPGFVRPGDTIAFEDIGYGEPGYEGAAHYRYIPDLNKLEARPVMHEKLLGAGISSALSLRLFARDELIGALALGHESPHAFSEADIELASRAANSLAIGLQNLEFFRFQRNRARVMDTLRKAGIELTSRLDLQSVVEAVCARSLQLVDADNAHMFYYDAGQLEFAAATWRDGVEGEIYRNPRPDGLTATVASKREAIAIMGTAGHELFQDAYGDWNGSIVGVPLKFEGNVIGVMTVSSQDPRQFTSDEIHALELLGDQAAIAITNARSYQEIEHQRAVLSTLLDIARRLATRHTMDEVFQTIVDAVVETLPAAEASSVMLLDPDREALMIMAGRGYPEGMVENRILPINESLAGQVFQTGVPMIVNNAQESSGFLGLGIPELDEVHALLGVPLVVNGETAGVLFADSFTQAEAFSEEDLPFLESLAAQASVAVESAHLFEQIRESRERLAELSARLVNVQEEERRHLARELHDQIGQSLTGLKLMLEMNADLPPQEAAKNLADSRRLVAELLQQVRDLSLDLRPSMLDDLGLIPALQWLVERWGRSSSTAIQLEHDGIEKRFSGPVETAAYRVIQEGLTNVLRHSGAERAVVRVSSSGDLLRLEVEDDGRGFDVEAVLSDPSRGGLSGMRERVLLLGGSIDMRAESRVGTVIEVELPDRGHVERRKAARRP